MYTEADTREASRRVKGCALVMALVLLPMLAAYVLALARGSYALSVAASLLMLCWLLFTGDLKLRPALRYQRFLKELGSGLRRQTECVIDHLDAEIQQQDGANVRCLHVVLPGGDSRIFYLNASKADFLPENGTRCTLVSFGRHAVDFSEN